MAGEVADGVILSVGVKPEVLARSIEAVHEGARATGRSPDEVEILSQLYVIVAETRERARRWAKAIISYFYEMTPAVLEWAGFRREPGRTPYLFPDPFHARNLDEAADTMAFLPDAMVDAFAIAGTAGDCVEQLRGLLASGFPLQELAVQPALTYVDADKPELTHEYFIDVMRRIIIPGVARP
jgi:alkanesulfonate monooxygenase SsuD/methylene tetrahydromethanopterin reductase-like flavin-dependent oxidoreductase (luciferase family)